MALRISKLVEILNLPEIYIRLRVWFNEQGDKLDVWALAYPSKEAFKADKRNYLHVPDMLSQYQLDYNREKDGNDILLFCHEKIKELLTTDVTEERESKSVIVKEKFCGDKEIQIELNKTIDDTSTAK